LTNKVSREAYATTLKKGNVSLEKIAEMLGHTSTMVTKNYLDSFDQEQIHEINQLLPIKKTRKGLFYFKAKKEIQEGQVVLSQLLGI